MRVCMHEHVCALKRCFVVNTSGGKYSLTAPVLAAHRHQNEPNSLGHGKISSVICLPHLHTLTPHTHTQEADVNIPTLQVPCVGMNNNPKLL